MKKQLEIYNLLHGNTGKHTCQQPGQLDDDLSGPEYLPPLKISASSSVSV
jgi:hypothetical protein